MNRRVLSFIGFVLVVVTGAFAQEPKGVQGDLIGQLKSAERKFVALAEKMTQEQYAWRPMEGVRSVGEVFVHISVSNIAFLEMAGIQVPMKADWGMEKSVTEKEKIVEMIKKTFKIAKDEVAKVADKDLDKSVKIFGTDGSLRSALVLLATHSHEHLGQAIAYARMNKVVPPWSESN